MIILLGSWVAQPLEPDNDAPRASVRRDAVARYGSSSGGTFRSRGRQHAGFAPDDCSLVEDYINNKKQHHYEPTLRAPFRACDLLFAYLLKRLAWETMVFVLHEKIMSVCHAINSQNVDQFIQIIFPNLFQRNVWYMMMPFSSKMPAGEALLPRKQCKTVNRLYTLERKKHGQPGPWVRARFNPWGRE